MYSSLEFFPQFNFNRILRKGQHFLAESHSTGLTGKLKLAKVGISVKMYGTFNVSLSLQHGTEGVQAAPGSGGYVGPE